MIFFNQLKTEYIQFLYLYDIRLFRLIRSYDKIAHLDQLVPHFLKNKALIHKQIYSINTRLVSKVYHILGHNLPQKERGTGSRSPWIVLKNLMNLKTTLDILPGYRHTQPEHRLTAAKAGSHSPCQPDAQCRSPAGWRKADPYARRTGYGSCPCSGHSGSAYRGRKPPRKCCGCSW